MQQLFAFFVNTKVSIIPRYYQQTLWWPIIKLLSVCEYLRAEFDKHHVLAWRGVSNNPQVLDARVAGRCELKQVVDGDRCRHSQQTQQRGALFAGQ